MPDRFTTKELRRKVAREAAAVGSWTAVAVNGEAGARKLAYSLRSRLHETLAFEHLYAALGAEEPLIWGPDAEDSVVRADFGARAWAATFKAERFKAGRGLLDEGPDRVERARAFVLARELCIEFTDLDEVTESTIDFARAHVRDPRLLIRAVRAQRTFDLGAAGAYLSGSVPAFADGAL